MLSHSIFKSATFPNLRFYWPLMNFMGFDSFYDTVKISHERNCGIFGIYNSFLVVHLVIAGDKTKWTNMFASCWVVKREHNWLLWSNWKRRRKSKKKKGGEKTPQ